MSRTPPAAPVTALLFAAALSAQATHVVGPGGFATLDAAVASAQPGDVVLVHPGTYTLSPVAIGLTIRAVTPGTVELTNSVSFDVPSPQVAHLVGIETNYMSVRGALTADDCLLGHMFSNTGSPAVHATDATLVLQGCQVGEPGAPYISFGGPHGLWATDSFVSAIDCTFRGLDYDTQFGAAASRGVQLYDSTFVGSGVTLTGGDGRANAPGAPGAGIGADATSRVWLADSDVLGGRALDLPGTPRHACPVEVVVGRLARCTLDPATCTSPLPLTGPVLAAGRAGPLVSGGTFTATFRGEPNRFIGVWAAFRVGALPIPGLEQPAMLDLGSAFPLTVLLADANGASSGTWSLPPNSSNLRLWLQALEDGAAPLQVSPVVGGVVR